MTIGKDETMPLDFTKPLADLELEAGAKLKALAHSSSAGIPSAVMEMAREWATTFPQRARKLVAEAKKLAVPV